MLSFSFCALIANQLGLESMVKKVFLWTSPRCISTAFERAMRGVKNSKVFHEPYKNPYHFGPERISKLFPDQPPNEDFTYENISSGFKEDFSNMELVFCKDMAKHIEKHFDILFDDSLADFHHTFLIRNPNKSVKSAYKLYLETGKGKFYPEEAGFRQMFELYEFVKFQTGTKPMIIDADDLLDNPEDTMKAYFDAIGCSFDKSILT